MNILGVDLSLTGTGLCYSSDAGVPGLVGFLASQIQHEFAGRHYYAGCVATNSGDQFTRWLIIKQAVRCLASSADLIVIEGYSYGSPFQAHALGELGGIIRFNLYENKSRFTAVPPQAVKKFVSGKAGCPKDIMIKEVFRRWQFDTNDNNVADAFSLCRIGEAISGIGTDDLTQAQREVIEVLTNPQPKTKKKRKAVE